MTRPDREGPAPPAQPSGGTSADTSRDFSGGSSEVLYGGLLGGVFDRLYLRLPLSIREMLRWRFVKFGIVGASGTVINVAVLSASQEFLLRGIGNSDQRLNFSIALAITCATINNFYWNRKLTWHDRRPETEGSTPLLFAKYVMAAGLSIAIQTLLTKWLAGYIHYAQANLLAIVAASVVTYLANDRFTFRRRVGPRQP